MEMSKSGFVISPGMAAVHHKMALHWSYLLLNVISKDESITEHLKIRYGLIV